MKTAWLIVAIFAVGIGLAMAQTNPGSPNAVDVEMQMAWPDGTVYISGIHNTEISYNFNTDPNYNGGVSYFNTVNWQAAAGGTGVQEAMPGTNIAYDNIYYWPSGGQWPTFPDGYYISEPSGATNSGILAGDDLNTSTFDGSLSFTTAYTTTTNQDSIQFNDQSQTTLITGGQPGSTGSELYSIAGGAASVNWHFTTPPFWMSESFTAIPPEQFQISPFGNFTDFSTSYDGLVSGTAWAVLPLHSQVPLIPNVSGSPYNEVGAVPQGYQLVSQCVATTPANRARTTLGVGEQVNLFFTPSLQANAFWKTSAGGLSTTNAPSTLFTAPSNATTATITVSVAGKALPPISYTVVAPNGNGYAIITGTNHFPVGEIAAGMTNTVWFYPTNVSFYRVYEGELPAGIANVTGYFTNDTSEIPMPEVGGSMLQQDNSGLDIVVTGLNSYSLPLYPGSWDYVVTNIWTISGSSKTNVLAIYNSTSTLLDAAGDFSVEKYGLTMTRTINDVSHASN